MVILQVIITIVCSYIMLLRKSFKPFARGCTASAELDLVENLDGRIFQYTAVHMIENTFDSHSSLIVWFFDRS